jgi:hypothetical protein
MTTPETPKTPEAELEAFRFTKEQWLTLPVLLAFRRYSNAHFATCADEHKEGVSDAAVKRRYDACDAAEGAFLYEIKSLLTALAAARKDSARLLNVARGCHDYNGGHYDAHDHETYHHGIQTVINALEAAAKRDPGDTQVNALERIGLAAGKGEGKTT